MATNLSDGADGALRQGHAIAADLRAPLTVCHVLPESFRVRVLFPQDAGVDASVQATLEQKALEVVRARVDSLVGRGEEAIVIEPGSPHAGILAVAERVAAGLIVVGPGATAQRVARASQAPVLVARTSPVGGAVLGATDFSDPALPGVRVAAAEAKRRGTRLRVLHCLEIDERAFLATVALPGAIYMPMPAGLLQELEMSARERLAESLAAAGTTGDTLVHHGPPARCIVEAAQEVATSLIVVGTHGKTGLARLTLGSVAEQVLADAPCSVLVVPLASS